MGDDTTDSCPRRAKNATDACPERVTNAVGARPRPGSSPLRPEAPRPEKGPPCHTPSPPPASPPTGSPAARPSSSAAADAGASAATDADAPALVDDFYAAINREFLATREIPADKYAVGPLVGDMDDAINEALTDLVRAATEDPGDDPDLRAIAALYAAGMDADARDAGGLGATAAAYLGRLEAAQTASEVAAVALDLEFECGLDPLFGADGVYLDLTGVQARWPMLARPQIGPDKYVWLGDSDTATATVSAFETLLAELWALAGKDADEAARIASDVCALCRDLASSCLDSDELTDPEIFSNPCTADELAELFCGALTPEQLREALGLGEGMRACVEEIEATRAFGAYFTDENADLLREYVGSVLLFGCAGKASTEASDAYERYYMTEVGATEPEDLETRVIGSLSGRTVAGFCCARAYCADHVPESAKQDVADIAAQLIDVLSRRIDDLDWMGDETKEAAKRKLSSMTVRAAYPDAWPQDAYDPGLEEGALFVDKVLAAKGAFRRYQMSQVCDTEQEILWPLAPLAVNAFYEPEENSITILAGILQAPFYDTSASRAANLGGIGMVIGHEITHALDSNGSKYDEAGVLNNWWTDEDRTQFEQRIDKVASYYDGYEVEGKQVDGAQTVTENTADLGGMACAVQVAQEEGLDLAEAFESYASSWAAKYTDAYLEILLADVHSPAEVRVNAICSALDAFYDTYDVQPGDGMYVAPEDRPQVW